jgi:hypothetical protein
MNPCLYEPQSFLKMLSLSRDVVIYIGITGGNAQPPKSKSLSELLTGRPPGHNGSNLAGYPFNLLLSMGFQPTMGYASCKWEYAEEPEQAMENFRCQYGHLSGNIPNMEQIISDYVSRQTENGMFVERSSCDMGIVACRVS